MEALEQFLFTGADKSIISLLGQNKNHHNIFCFLEVDVLGGVEACYRCIYLFVNIASFYIQPDPSQVYNKSLVPPNFVLLCPLLTFFSSALREAQ